MVGGPETIAKGVGDFIARYRSAGLFGFKLGFSSGSANWALRVEIVATVLALITAAVMAREAKSARSTV